MATKATKHVCDDPLNQCAAVPTRCTTKDGYSGQWVKGLSCDGGKTCDKYATGDSCYSQCIDGDTKCHSMYANYLH